MRFELGTYFAADRHTNNLAMPHPSPAISTVLYLQLILAVFILQSRVPCIQRTLHTLLTEIDCNICTLMSRAKKFFPG
jgi:hypothetical protein